MAIDEGSNVLVSLSNI